MNHATYRALPMLTLPSITLERGLKATAAIVSTGEAKSCDR